MGGTPVIDRGWDRRRFALAIAGTVALGGCTAPGRGRAPGLVPAATVAAFDGNDEAAPLLVDAAWLRSRLDQPGLLLLDVSAEATYGRGHVPGAVHGWWRDATDRFARAFGMVLGEETEPAARAALLGGWGVAPGTTVIVYDDARNRYAAWVVWVLRYLGHERAAVLDGGLAAWRGAGGAVDREAHAAPEVSPVVTAQRGFVMGTRELRDRLDDPTLIILDARTPGEAADDLNGTLPIGAIPGSRSVPWTSALRDDAGRLKPPADLLALYRAAGVVSGADHRVVVYARFGVEAGHTWWVLKLLGFPHVRLYDAGWAGWAT